MNINQSRKRTFLVYKIFYLSLIFVLSACSGRPFHPTVLDALTEAPGFLIKKDPVIMKSVRILRQQNVAGGISVLYRWQTRAAASAGTDCISVTFVTPEGQGWRAQSSGSFELCNFTATSSFEAAYYPGGNITALTTAYGLSNHGSKVRIMWSDGKTSYTTVENGAFLDARPETLRVLRAELLDASNRVLEIEDFQR
jgi:hypothetical protein